MITTATSSVRPDFRRNRLLQTLAAGFAVYWLAMAVAPVYRFDWFLENLLVFVAAAAFAASYRAFPFSDLSYVLLTAFLALHTLGSHYGTRTTTLRPEGRSAYSSILQLRAA